MIEFEINGVQYGAGPLSAKRQLHVVRRLAPLLSGPIAALVQAGGKLQAADVEEASSGLDALLAGVDLPKIFEGLGAGLAGLTDADADYVVDSCLGVVSRRQQGGSWAPLMSGSRLMFEDLDLAAMLAITGRVLQDNLSGFFPMLRRISGRATPT